MIVDVTYQFRPEVITKRAFGRTIRKDLSKHLLHQITTQKPFIKLSMYIEKLKEHASADVNCLVFQITKSDWLKLLRKLFVLSLYLTQKQKSKISMNNWRIRSLVFYKFCLNQAQSFGLYILGFSQSCLTITLTFTEPTCLT